MPHSQAGVRLLQHYYSPQSLGSPACSLSLSLLAGHGFEVRKAASRAKQEYSDKKNHQQTICNFQLNSLSGSHKSEAFQMQHVGRSCATA